MKWFIIFLVQVILLVTGGYLLTIYPGLITINWIGYQAETSLLVFFTILLIVSLTLGLVIKIISTVIKAPSILKTHYHKRFSEKARYSLIEAMIALFAQDTRQIARKSEEIRRFLPEQDLANFLEAEAAFFQGDITSAQQLYQKLFYSLRLQFLACQGMTRIHLRLENAKQALEWAQKAKTAYDNSFWARDVIVNLAIKTNNLSLALAELNDLIKLNLGCPQENKQKKAEILTKLADQAKQEGALETALIHAEEAYKLASSNHDISLLYANLVWQLKGTKAALKVIEQIWALSPDPKLAELYINITHPDSGMNKMKMIKRLASFAPHHPESYLAITRAAIDAKLWSEARDLLNQLIANGYQAETVLKLLSQLDDISY